MIPTYHDHVFTRLINLKKGEEIDLKISAAGKETKKEDRERFMESVKMFIDICKGHPLKMYSEIIVELGEDKVGRV